MAKDSSSKSDRETQRPGPGVDAMGRTVIDPTENVKALTEAAVTRLNDLSEANSVLQATEIKRLEEAVKHLEHIVALRAEHAKELSDKEGNRLDSIRQFDVQAVSTAAERSQAAINALASVTTANAENLRNALNATATTIANQLSNTVASISERIAKLEQLSYTGLGKATVADPQMAELVAAVNKLMSAGSLSAGKSQGISLVGALMVSAVTLILGLMGISGVLYAVLKR